MIDMIKNGLAVLADPMQNKGTGFTQAERVELGIDGLLPSAVQTIEQQEAMVYERFCAQPTDLAKRMYLMSVLDSNTRLYYYSMARHLTEYMPMVYAPTVAQSIEGFDDHYFGSRVAYVDVKHPENIEKALKQFAGDSDIRLVVATDSEGILGIGDWGVNGAEILTGKLAVYTAAAAIDPTKILPVMIDAGTNRKELLDDPRYMGMRCERIRGKEYDDFIEEFVNVSLRLYPEALLHWEDFGRPCAAPILERYRDKVLTLNDDIQGTGVTVLGALEASRRVAGTSYDDAKIVIFGAGTAGMGIADQIVDGMVAFGNMTLEAAQARIYAVDRQGLILKGMPDLTEGQRRYAPRCLRVPCRRRSLDPRERRGDGQAHGPRRHLDRARRLHREGLPRHGGERRAPLHRPHLQPHQARGGNRRRRARLDGRPRLGDHWHPLGPGRAGRRDLSHRPGQQRPHVPGHLPGGPAPECQAREPRDAARRCPRPGRHGRHHDPGCPDPSAHGGAHRHNPQRGEGGLPVCHRRGDKPR
jgi:malic enzyme